MSAVFCLVLFISVFFCSCKANQKKTYLRYFSHIELNTDILIGPGECLLKKFQGTSINNMFYVNWIFISNTGKFIFQLEKSEDGKLYVPCCIKEGAWSPNSSVPLLICFKDSMSKSEIVFFRLKAIPQDYNLGIENIRQYNTMFNASTIMLRKNEKTKEFNLALY